MSRKIVCKVEPDCSALTDRLIAASPAHGQLRHARRARVAALAGQLVQRQGASGEAGAVLRR